MRNIISCLLLASFLITPGNAYAALPSHSAAYQGSAYDVIAAINQYRSASGLPQLQINNTLMGTAQAQSNYQASIGSVTHTGEGGTSAKDRAIAAGYGSGSSIFLSEIIYGGMTATVDVAMEWWKNSSVHNTVMLTSTYSEIGAGVASNGTSTYFTAVLASVSGSIPAVSNNDQDDDQQAQPALPEIAPVVKADPGKDGSIVHTIQTGQALWTLAIVYGVDLQTLLDLNDLPETALIFPGDEIIIQPAFTPTPTLMMTKTPKTATKSAKITSATPNVTNTLESSNELPVQQEEKGNDKPIISEERVSPTVRWIVILAFALLFLIVIGSMFLQKPPERPPDDDPVR